jgi:hypothetical protein
VKTYYSRNVSGNRGWTGAAAMILILALVCGLAARAGAQSFRKLTGHVPAATANLVATGRLAAETKMRLSIGLPLRNGEALTNLLRQLYDPASPSFRHFISMDEFTRRFGPTTEDYQKVMDFAQSRGLKTEVQHPNRMLVEVTGRVADVEKAFQVTLRTYRHPTENRTFFAPDREPSVEAGLSILHISGLDNYVAPRAMSHPTPAGGANPASGSGPGGNFAGIDFRAAYVPGTTLTGAGQSVGLLEYAGYYVSDILQYETNYNLPNVPLNNVVLDGLGSVADNPGGAEQPLDIEMAISMAPGLAQVIIYYGNNGDDILNRMATDNLAKQLSASWTYGIDDTTLQIFQEFDAQGQNYFNASGDSDAYTTSTATPCDVPYITCVGGTTLSTSGPGGIWTSETAWNWGGTGTSGGVSAHYALPMWQEGLSMVDNQGSTTMRNIPDVALTADNIWVLHDNGGTGSYGGTSCATPLWAAFLALANEQAASNSLPPVGFINPAVYAIGKNGSYSTTFHDINTGSNTNEVSPTKYLAVTGYDLCTGWGTPRGTNLINALAGVGAPSLLLYAAPAALTITAGGRATVLVTEVALNTANSSVSLSVTNLPAGMTASFNPSSTTSTSILTLTAASKAAAGTVTLTLTGTNAIATNTATVNLTVLPPAPGATAVSLSTSFNTTGIYIDGARFSGGLDGDGNALSANLLPSGLSFNGCVFNLGPSAGSDAVKCSGQYVTLPSGQYSCLNLLATGVNGNQVNQLFVVNYTDGTSSTFIQSVSDWAIMQSYPGQALVSFTGYNDTSGGTKNTTTSASLYGYSFALNPNKVVKNIKLPVDAGVMVLAMSMANDFSLYASPFAPTLTAGGREVVLLNAAPLNGLTGGIALSATNISKGVTASFSPISTASTSLLTLLAASTATPSNGQIMVSGTLGGVTHEFTLGLGVLAATPGATIASPASAFNCQGLCTDGATFSAAGSMDGNGNCYSSTLLGASPSWNGSVFSLGTANETDAVRCSGQTIGLPAGQFPVLLMLGGAVNNSQPGQTFIVTYTDGASSTNVQSMSLWTSPSYYAGEAVAASMAYLDTSAGTNNTASPVNLYGYAFSLDDTKTVKSVILPDNTNVIVLALSLANAPWSVSLASSFNAIGVAADGAGFSGGADGDGNAYSSNLLGSLQIWNSTPFNLGPANASDIVRCTGQTISLPPERETQLYLLASGVNANQASQTFTVTYATGSPAVFTQSLSDWNTPQNYAGESIVATMSYRDGSSGAPNNTTVHLYGYAFTLDNTRVARSLTLPDNGDVIVLGITVKNGPVPMSLASAFNRAGTYTDGTTFSATGGMDGDGNAYSANQLGSNQFWMNMFFNFGPFNATNAVSCAGQTLSLPTGQFASLSLLATGVNGNQTSQQFKVTYTNNVTTTFTENFSDWVVPTFYGGQTVLLTMPYHDGSGGGYDNSEANLYGYTLTLDSAYVVRSITLPNNANVEILALTLSNATPALTEAPSIHGQPQSLVVTNGGPASFSVSAIGTPVLNYRWRLNGANLADGVGISGSGTSNLTLSDTTTNEAGSYTVVVANSYGSVTSSVATLSVLSPPTIFSQPVSLTATLGSPASFSVGAAGSAPLGYQWQINGSNLVDGGEISGAETNALTLSDTTTNDAGSYTVVITNMAGSVTSAVAVLTITLPIPMFLPTTLTESGLIVFAWTAVPGQQYQVQYTGDLSSGSWTNLGPAITATNGIITDSDTIGPAAQRFYQVLLLQ